MQALASGDDQGGGLVRRARPAAQGRHPDRAEDPAASAAYRDAAEALAKRRHYERAMRLIERGRVLAKAEDGAGVAARWRPGGRPA